MYALFGTDGIRGTTEFTNEHRSVKLTPELALRIGQAVGCTLTPTPVREGGRALAIIGRDPRISGMMLESALTAGLLAQGVDVLQAGVIPTPAVAYLTRHLGASLGVVISASHNPVEDNGIKFFGPDGYKLADALEERIQSLVLDPKRAFTPRDTRALGRSRLAPELAAAYVDYLVRSWRGKRDLSGIRVVLECANGATSFVAPEAFRRLGAEVEVLNGDPDGLNINKSYEYIEPRTLAARVVAAGAHLGVAFDGDGDRVILVDERGGMVDGDGILALLARHFHTRGLLPVPVIVATPMSNFGLHEYLRLLGIEVVEAKVGDKFVLERMRELGTVLGGEQSGHILILDRDQTTGDGIYTALVVAALVVDEADGSLSRLMAGIPRYPQAMVSLEAPRVSVPLTEIPEIRAILDDLRAQAGEGAEVLLRYSGTEDKLRLSVRTRAVGDPAMLVEGTRRALEQIVARVQHEASRL
ncbi:MAG: phosphoglucosamine mutase [Anaerolineae bacterium]|nr:phosphoglucosamine mutase [Anaerolineae bacterium]MDW8068952.1 phosphoglucosamine mutase [Anaerolineae bacterium]